MLRQGKKAYIALSLLSPIFILPLVFKSFPRYILPDLVTQDVFCPSVLDNMMKGTWQTRKLTRQEEKEINVFLMKGLFFANLRNGFQKPDGSCGNITYYPWMSNKTEAQWFRVLCDPNGTTPCCYNNRCEYKTIEECRCPRCFDLRPRLFAEYSTWVPDDPRCKVKNYTSETACDLLRGGTLHFYGDSLVRQMYLAMVIILKGDYQNGGLRPNTPKAIKSQCQGMYVFPTKNCRGYLDYKPTVCGGNVSLEFHHIARHQETLTMLQAAIPLRGRNKTIILYGCGVWKQFDVVDTSAYALSLLNTLFPVGVTRVRWPKVVWSGFHDFGLWTNPLFPTVNNKFAALFNQYMQRVVGLYKVPMFDSVNITRGVRSVDGTHHGPGVNFLKAQIYLNYIAELEHNGVWR